jgi:hypothetical protein
MRRQRKCVGRLYSNMPVISIYSKHRHLQEHRNQGLAFTKRCRVQHAPEDRVVEVVQHAGHQRADEKDAIVP